VIPAYGAAVVLAYLLGSIPVGLIVVKALTGRDIRQVGSGRTGGTNALRAGGTLSGVLTGIGDFLKGYGAVSLARLLAPGNPYLEAVVAVAAVTGHNWSIFIRFKGGAGTGPNVGAAAALWPWAAAILFPAVPIILLVTGYASVTSTLVAAAIVIIFTIRAALLDAPLVYAGYALGAAVLVSIALLPNYRRLAAGTERRLGKRPKAAQPSE
jgi:glycerol-3-phosphate acyltransferase PlsY